MRALPLALLSPALLLGGCTTPQSFARNFSATHCENLSACDLLDEDRLNACEERTEEWLVALVDDTGCAFDGELGRDLLDEAGEASCAQSGDWDYVLELVTLDELVPYTGAAVYTCPAESVGGDDFWQSFERVMAADG